MIGTSWATKFSLLFGLFAATASYAAPTNESFDGRDIGLDVLFDEALLYREQNASGLQTWEQFLSFISNAHRVQWGIQFDGRNPWSRNAAEPMMPASTLKVVTAITALKELGRDFKFHNSFTGNVDSLAHTLSDPEFTVSGDPTWGHKYYEKGDVLLRMNQMIDALRTYNIKKIIGPLKITSTAPYLDEVKRPAEDHSEWRLSWRDVCYATLPTSVILSGNCATLTITGFKSAVWNTPGVSIPIHVNLRSKGGATTVTPIMDQNLRVVSYQITGVMPGKKYRSFQRPVHQSDQWLKNLFFIAIRRAGIQYEEGSAAPAQTWNLPFWNQTPKLQVDLSSPPLHEMLVPFIQESINIVGDRLFLELAQKRNPIDPSQIERETILEITEGRADLSKSKITDGCGLRLDNRLSASTMKLLLEGVRAKPYFADFLKTLAVAGVSGTLEKRALLSGSRHAKGRIFGKTGTVNGVKNLVGYFQKPDASLEAFAFLAQTTLDEKFIAAMTDQVLVEFARQNSGLGGFERPVLNPGKSSSKAASKTPTQAKAKS